MAMFFAGSGLEASPPQLIINAFLGSVEDLRARRAVNRAEAAAEQRSWAARAITRCLRQRLTRRWAALVIDWLSLDEDMPCHYCYNSSMPDWPLPGALKLDGGEYGPSTVNFREGEVPLWWRRAINGGHPSWCMSRFNHLSFPDRPYTGCFRAPIEVAVGVSGQPHGVPDDIEYYCSACWAKRVEEFKQIPARTLVFHLRDWLQLSSEDRADGFFYPQMIEGFDDWDFSVGVDYGDPSDIDEPESPASSATIWTTTTQRPRPPGRRPGRVVQTWSPPSPGRGPPWGSPERHDYDREGVRLRAKEFARLPGHGRKWKRDVT